MNRGFALVLWLIGLVSLVNAAWMLAHAGSWFAVTPGVGNTGPLNAHFVHDVGLAYGVCGAGLLWCAARPAACRPVYLGIAAFLAGHAVMHAVEIALGRLPPGHWWIDLPLVFAPGVVLAVGALPAVWRRLVPAGAGTASRAGAA